MGLEVLVVVVSEAVVHQEDFNRGVKHGRRDVCFTSCNLRVFWISRRHEKVGTVS